MVEIDKTKSNLSAKRDPFIDIIRGLAVLGVLCIHTAFWSGQSYTPVWLQSLTLIFDVPVFFFISGFGSGSKSMGDIVRQLNGLWKNFFGKAIFFVIVMVLICSLFGMHVIADGEDLLKNFSLSFSFEPFPVLSGSMWFVTYYVRTVIINGLLICFLKPYLEKIGYTEADLIKSLLILNIALFLMSCANIYYLPINMYQTDFFYNIMWLLGAYAAKKDICIKSKATCLVILCVDVLMFLISCKVLQVDMLTVQNMKFPTKPAAMLPWLFYSLVSIILVLFLRSKVCGTSKFTRAIAHIGKNSIFYLFAQGISSSIIYNFLNWQIPAWWQRFALMYLLNVAIAVIIAESFILCHKMLLQQLNNIRELAMVKKIRKRLSNELHIQK